MKCEYCKKNPAIKGNSKAFGVICTDCFYQMLDNKSNYQHVLDQDGTGQDQEVFDGQ